MNKNNKNKNRTTMMAIFAIVSILVVTIITAYSTLLTQAIEQAQAQTLNATGQKSLVTDINVHFKTACLSVIVFTYCW